MNIASVEWTTAPSVCSSCGLYLPGDWNHFINQMHIFSFLQRRNDKTFDSVFK